MGNPNVKVFFEENNVGLVGLVSENTLGNLPSSQKMESGRDL